MVDERVGCDVTRLDRSRRRTRGSLALAAATVGVLLSCTNAPPPTAKIDERLLFEPEELVFGEIFLAAGFTKSVTLKNMGRTAANLELEPPSVDFEVKPTSLRIPAGGEAEVRVRFQPSQERVFDEMIGYRTSSGTKVDLRVRGQGVPSSIEVEPKVIDFLSVPRGERRVETFAIRSLTDGDLELHLTITGSPGFDVEHARLGLGARSEVELELGFVATGLGAQGAWLEIRPCGGCPTTRIDLRGESVAPRLEAIPELVNFGTIPEGFSDVRNVTLRNTGTLGASLDVPRLEPRDGPFELLAPEPRLSWLEPGQQFDVEIAFASDGIGRREAILYLGEEGAPLVIPVSAEGGGAILVGHGVDFGLWPLGFEPKRVATIENVGLPWTIEIEEVSLEGEDASSFVLEHIALPHSFREGSVPFDISLQAARAGALQAELVVRTSSRFQGEIRIPLRADVPAPACDLRTSPSNRVRLGLVDGSKSHEFSFVITHQGEGECVIWGMELSGDEESFEIRAGETTGFQRLEKDIPLVVEVVLSELAPATRLFPKRVTTLSFHHDTALSDPVERVMDAQPVLPFPISFSSAELVFPATPLGRKRMAPLPILTLSRVIANVQAPAGFQSYPWKPPLHYPLLFEPTHTGVHHGNLEIYFTSWEEPVLFPVRGTGSPDCDEPCDWPTVECLEPSTYLHPDPPHFTFVMFPIEATGDDLICDWVVQPLPSYLPVALPCEVATTTISTSRVFEVETVVTDAQGRAATCEQVADVVIDP